MSKNMMDGIQFDAQKFEDVVHFIVDYASVTFGIDSIGNTKLHKCLYYADMLTFLDSMKPLTGAEYQRQKFGPTARHLSRALKNLEDNGRIKTESVNYYGYQKKQYIPIQSLETNRLSQAEMDLIAHVADFVCRRTAVEISEFSHDEVWNSVPMGQAIPYFAAFAMFPAEFSPADLEAAEIEAQQIAPQIAEEKRAGRLF